MGASNCPSIILPRLRNPSSPPSPPPTSRSSPTRPAAGPGRTGAVRRTKAIPWGAVLSWQLVAGPRRCTLGGMADVTSLIAAAGAGDPGAAAELLPLVYDELRRLAAGHLARERPGQ